MLDSFDTYVAQTSPSSLKGWNLVDSTGAAELNDGGFGETVPVADTSFTMLTRRVYLRHTKGDNNSATDLSKWNNAAGAAARSIDAGVNSYCQASLQL